MPRPTELARPKEFLRTVVAPLAIAMLGLLNTQPATAEIHQSASIEQTAAAVTTIGPETLTIFNRDRLMELQVEYRTGTQGGWVFENNAFQRAILAATSIDDLRTIKGLIVDDAMFEAARTYNPNLLSSMQNSINNQCLTAVDAHRFYMDGRQMAAGIQLTMTITHKVNADGQLVELPESETLECNNWDVLAYDSKDRFFADVTPATYKKLGVFWDADAQRVKSQKGMRIPKLPTVSLTLDSNSAFHAK
jgi:hypothetical protein